MTFYFFFNVETWKTEHSFDKKKGTNLKDLLRELSFDFKEQIDEIPEEETDELGEDFITPNVDDSRAPTATASTVPLPTTITNAPPIHHDPPILQVHIVEDEVGAATGISKESFFSHTDMGTTTTAAARRPIRTQRFNRCKNTTRVPLARRTNAYQTPRHAWKTKSNPAAATSGSRPNQSTAGATGNTSPQLCGNKHSRTVQELAAAGHTTIRRRHAAVVFRHKKRPRYSTGRLPVAVVLDKKHRRTSADYQHHLQLQSKKQRCTAHYYTTSGSAAAANTPNSNNNNMAESTTTTTKREAMASANRSPPVGLGQKKRNRSEQSTCCFEPRRRLQPFVLLYKRARREGVDMATTTHRRDGGGVVQMMLGTKRSSPSSPAEENASTKTCRLV